MLKMSVRGIAEGRRPVAALAVDHDLEPLDRLVPVKAGADAEHGGGAADRERGRQRVLEVDPEVRRPAHGA